MVTIEQFKEFNDYLAKGKFEVGIIKEFTQYDVINMLTEIRTRAWQHHSKFDDDIDFEVDKAIEDIVGYVDEIINTLKEIHTNDG